VQINVVSLVFLTKILNMQEANITNLLKTIVWIIIIYYAIKFIARLLFPILAKKVIEKASKQFQEQQQKYNQNQPKSNYNINTDKPKEKKKVGEYIYYEDL
jgi:hypothetical protein